MALYAIDDLDDTWTATREFLLPLSVKRLAVLAVIVFFVGGTGLNLPGGGGTGGPPDDTASGVEPGIDAVREFVLDNALAIGLIGAAILSLVLAFAFIGALMEFVFVQSLRTDEVRFWGYSRAYFASGLRLFGFRIVLGIVGFVSTLTLFGVGLVAFGVGEVQVGGLALAALAVLAVLAILATSLVDAFTTAFVVPVMMVRETGVLGSWRTFWPTLVGAWKQYLAYGVAALILTIAAGIVVAMLLGIAAIAAGIPLAIVGGLTLVTVGTGETVTVVVIAALVVLFVAVMIVVGLLLQVPVQTYLRYYALFVLGDTDRDLDPIPEIRAAVRDRDDPGSDPATI